MEIMLLAAGMLLLGGAIGLVVGFLVADAPTDPGVAIAPPFPWEHAGSTLDPSPQYPMPSPRIRAARGEEQR